MKLFQAHAKSNYQNELKRNKKVLGIMKVIALLGYPFVNSTKVKLRTLKNLNANAQPVHVWNDGGSGSCRDVSIWRANTYIYYKSDGTSETYFSVGDRATPSHQEPDVYLMTTTDQSQLSAVFKVPKAYHALWSDAGSGAYMDLVVWYAECDENFESLGVVATNGPYPAYGSIYCIRSDYTIGLSYIQWIWDDSCSGANVDVGFYEIVEDKYIWGGLSANGFYACGYHYSYAHGCNYSDPYAFGFKVLKKEKLALEKEEPFDEDKVGSEGFLRNSVA